MMKRLLLILGLLISSSSCWATWTFKQAKCNGTTTTDGCTSGTTCAVSGLTAITAGSTVVGIALTDGGGNFTISSINGETWTACASCRKAGTATQEVDASYVLSATGGETSFTFTMSATIVGMSVCIYEAKSSLTAAFDTAANSLISSAAPTTVTLTPTGSNDFLVGALVWGGSVTGITAPYANMIESNGNGTAENVNSASGTGAVFTPTTANSGPDFTIAFKESGAAAPSGFNKRQKIEQLEGIR